MFRLYNASFKRLPDPDGLRYWISNFSSGIDDERAVASSFLASAEFKQRYGENVTNESYVNTLYINILGRDYDQAGYSYWLGNLNNGIETRYELLLGFSESIENKALFSEITGLEKNQQSHKLLKLYASGIKLIMLCLDKLKALEK